MKEYILAVCGAVVISALISLLLPEGKTGRFIGGILKLFCLLVMLVPLFQMFEQFTIPENGQEVSSEYEPDEDFLLYVYEKQAEAREEEIEEIVEKEFSVDVSTDVLWEYAQYGCNVTEIKIKIENFGIYGDDEHIYVIQQIKSYVSEFARETEVNVYE